MDTTISLDDALAGMGQTDADNLPVQYGNSSFDGYESNSDSEESAEDPDHPDAEQRNSSLTASGRAGEGADLAVEHDLVSKAIIEDARLNVMNMEPDVGASFSQDERGTIRLDSVEVNGAMFCAGLAEGDTVLQVQGHPMRDIYALNSLCQDTQPGQELRFKVLNKKGVELDLVVKMGSRDKPLPEVNRLQRLCRGMVNQEDRANFRKMFTIYESADEEALESDAVDSTFTASEHTNAALASPAASRVRKVSVGSESPGARRKLRNAKWEQHMNASKLPKSDLWKEKEHSIASPTDSSEPLVGSPQDRPSASSHLNKENIATPMSQSFGKCSPHSNTPSPPHHNKNDSVPSSVPQSSSSLETSTAAARGSDLMTAGGKPSVFTPEASKLMRRLSESPVSSAEEKFKKSEERLAEANAAILALEKREAALRHAKSLLLKENQSKTDEIKLVKEENDLLHSRLAGTHRPTPLPTQKKHFLQEYADSNITKEALLELLWKARQDQDALLRQRRAMHATLTKERKKIAHLEKRLMKLEKGLISAKRSPFKQSPYSTTKTQTRSGFQDLSSSPLSSSCSPAKASPSSPTKVSPLSSKHASSGRCRSSQQLASSPASRVSRSSPLRNKAQGSHTSPSSSSQTQTHLSPSSRASASCARVSSPNSSSSPVESGSKPRVPPPPSTAPPRPPSPRNSRASSNLLSHSEANIAEPRNTMTSEHSSDAQTASSDTKYIAAAVSSAVSNLSVAFVDSTHTENFSSECDPSNPSSKHIKENSNHERNDQQRSDCSKFSSESAFHPYSYSDVPSSSSSSSSVSSSSSSTSSKKSSHARSGSVYFLPIQHSPTSAHEKTSSASLATSEIWPALQVPRFGDTTVASSNTNKTYNTRQRGVSRHRRSHTESAVILKPRLPDSPLPPPPPSDEPPSPPTQPAYAAAFRSPQKRILPKVATLSADGKVSAPPPPRQPPPSTNPGRANSQQLQQPHRSGRSQQSRKPLAAANNVANLPGVMPLPGMTSIKVPSRGRDKTATGLPPSASMSSKTTSANVVSPKKDSSSRSSPNHKDKASTDPDSTCSGSTKSQRRAHSRSASVDVSSVSRSTSELRSGETVLVLGPWSPPWRNTKLKGSKIDKSSGEQVLSPPVNVPQIGPAVFSPPVAPSSDSSNSIQRSRSLFGFSRHAVR
eukprot:g35577.t1